eukprot:scaffold71728_cov75-Phaeocystis_antarctica.AAC.2
MPRPSQPASAGEVQSAGEGKHSVSQLSARQRHAQQIFRPIHAQTAGMGIVNLVRARGESDCLKRMRIQSRESTCGAGIIPGPAASEYANELLSLSEEKRVLFGAQSNRAQRGA